VAKENKSQPDKAPKKSATPSKGVTSGSFFHNAVIIIILSIVFIAIYNLNGERAELPDLYNEMYDLKERPGDHSERLNEISHRLHDIETDTAFVKSLFVGYFEDVHSIAFLGQQQLDNATAEIKKLKAQYGNDNDGPLTREDKLRYKVHTFMLMDLVNANCPPNSVILLPPADSLESNSKWNFIYDPLWAEYFIYPRLCIASGKESENPELAKRITHVLIVKGIGYDKLKYNVPMDKREPLCLLPINKPVDTTQPSN
jgi:hypothetical protein